MGDNESRTISEIWNGDIVILPEMEKELLVEMLMMKRYLS